MTGRHLALVGTTASGKSALALAIARECPDVELVSIDSMQVYRGMDIGTDKPSAAEREEVHHHLVDLVDPDEDFTVTRFQAAYRVALGEIEARGHRAILVGGTGLYLRAAVDDLDFPGEFPVVRARLETEPDVEALHTRLRELDPVAASRMEPTNRRRVLRALEVCLGSGRPFSSFGPGMEQYPPTDIDLLGIWLPPPMTAERIATRYGRQMEAGFLDEVRTLANAPRGLARNPRQALGYRELLSHLEDGVPLTDALDRAIVRTRQFARRQRSWFRRDPRITWLGHSGDSSPLLPVVLRDWYECA